MLDVKVVLLDNVTGLTTTYHPLSQYVRANCDVASIVYSKVSTNGDSALNATLTNNTNMQANVFLARNDKSTLNATTAPAIIVLAQYSADNQLKNVSSVVCDTIKIWESQTWQYAVTLPSITIAAGDYFRTYVWNSISGLKPITQDKNTVDMPIYEKHPLNLN